MFGHDELEFNPKGGNLVDKELAVSGIENANFFFDLVTGGGYSQNKYQRELVANYEVEMEKNITARWEADLKSDSWLSKNVRPMVLIFLIVCTMLLIFIDAGALKFEVKSSWVDLLQLVLITVIGAYFGGRSFEKVKK